MLHYVLALLCFQFIISPSSEVEVAQLTIRQADVSFALAKYLGKQTQSWGGWVGVTAREPGSLQGTSGEERMLRAVWSRGPPCTLGAGCTGERCWAVEECLCRMELSPKDSVGRKSRKTSPAWKHPCKGSRDGSRNARSGGRPSWHGERDSPAQHIPAVKGGHLVMPGGQAEPGMELLSLQPLYSCARFSSWSQRDVLSPPGCPLPSAV